MKFFVVFLLLCASLASTISFSTDFAEGVAAFEKYKKAFEKSYPDAETEKRRLMAYINNRKRSRELAQRNPRALFGDTPFSDLSVEEFTTYHNNQKGIQDGMAEAKKRGIPVIDPRSISQAKNLVLPASIDWRLKGAVTPVKNQQQCGSCWAFSTTGNIEGQWFLAGHNLTSLSEQDLVSCNFLSFGCDGGFSVLAYGWMRYFNNGSIATEASYPYTSGAGVRHQCWEKNSTVRIGATISGGSLLLPWDAEGMKIFLAARGPLSVAVDASSFQTYISGIMTQCETLLPDHQVLVVGYSTSEEGVPYWIVKNSWGTQWGEDGYIRIESGKNLCQIELVPNSATIEHV